LKIQNVQGVKGIYKVKLDNYKNYFKYAYNLKEGYELKMKKTIYKNMIYTKYGV